MIIKAFPRNPSQKTTLLTLSDAIPGLRMAFDLSKLSYSDFPPDTRFVNGVDLCVATYCDSENFVHPKVPTIQISQRLIDSFHKYQIDERQHDVPLIVIPFANDDYDSLLDIILERVIDFAKVILLPSHNSFRSDMPSTKFIRHPNLTMEDVYGKLDNYLRRADAVIYASHLRTIRVRHNQFSATQRGLLFAINTNFPTYGTFELEAGGSIVSRSTLEELADELASFVLMGSDERAARMAKAQEERTKFLCLSRSYIRLLDKIIYGMSTNEYSAISELETPGLRIYHFEEHRVVRVKHDSERYSVHDDQL